MAPIALTPNETWKYQLIDDRMPDGDGARTKDSRTDPRGTFWTLRSLPSWLERQITDQVKFERKKDGGELVHRNTGTIMEMILEHGVVAVENWKLANGQDVPLKKKSVNGHDVTDLAFCEYLATKHQTELCLVIEARTKVPVSDSD